MGMDGQGWHNDPSRRHELRWWDGAAWSSYVADDGVVAVDEVVPPAPPPRPPAFAPEPVVMSEPDDDERDVELDVRRASLPVRVWRTIRARPLWARIAALLVIALAILAVILTGGTDDRNAGSVVIDGLGSSPATRPPTSAAPPSAASTTRATERRPATTAASRTTSPPTVARRAPASPVTPARPAPTVARVAPPPRPACDRNYDPCVPVASDVDCANGSGNGPAFVDGPVRVVGSDVYGLDRDGNGVGCD
jgi:hypothetical protein